MIRPGQLVKVSHSGCRAQFLRVLSVDKEIGYCKAIELVTYPIINNPDKFGYYTVECMLRTRDCEVIEE